MREVRRGGIGKLCGRQADHSSASHRKLSVSCTAMLPTSCPVLLCAAVAVINAASKCDVRRINSSFSLDILVCRNVCGGGGGGLFLENSLSVDSNLDSWFQKLEMYLRIQFVRAGRSGDRIPVDRFAAPVRIGPGAHPASYTMGHSRG